MFGKKKSHKIEGSAPYIKYIQSSEIQMHELGSAKEGIWIKISSETNESNHCCWCKPLLFQPREIFERFLPETNCSSFKQV